jgi:hypothetical protein
MVGKPKLPNWLAYIRPHVAPYQALGRGERRKYIEKLSKKTKLSDNSLRRFIAAAQFLEAEGITDLPPNGRLPLGSVEHIARIAAHDPSRRRALLEEVAAGCMTIEQVAAELKVLKTKKVRHLFPNALMFKNLIFNELGALGISTRGFSIHTFDDVIGDRVYFDDQTKPAFVVTTDDHRLPIAVMDGRRFGGTGASFTRQRKEFLRNVLVAAALYAKVLVYAPYWYDDVKRLIRHAQPEVGSRITLIGPATSDDPAKTGPAAEAFD